MAFWLKRWPEAVLPRIHCRRRKHAGEAVPAGRRGDRRHWHRATSYGKQRPQSPRGRGADVVAVMRVWIWRKPR